MSERESHGVQFVTASERDEGQRLDNCLFRLFKTLPKSRVYRLLRKGEIRVNKKRVLPEYRLNVGDLIRIPPLDLETENTRSLHLKPNEADVINRAILREETEWLVLNKPHGLSVHAGTDTRLGVIEMLRLARPELKFVELAHRLDKETSGALLIAKTPAALKGFHQMLRDREAIRKTYRLQVKGVWPKRLNRVDEPIEGKPSRTTFQVLSASPLVTELSAVLHTGRQHQIRIHCQKAGFPVVGDSKYGDFAFNRMFSKTSGQKRMFLHAMRLEFDWKGQSYCIEAPLEEAWHIV